MRPVSLLYISHSMSHFKKRRKVQRKKFGGELRFLEFYVPRTDAPFSDNMMIFAACERERKLVCAVQARVIALSGGICDEQWNEQEKKKKKQKAGKDECLRK